MSSAISNSKGKDKLCACNECPYQGSIHLEVELIRKKGLFCPSCARDLKWHGIAREVGS
jgi:hypothetical protein